MPDDLTGDITGDAAARGLTAATSSPEGVARGEADLKRYATVEELLIDKLSEAIGGWRGAVESAVPTLAFVLVWTVRKDLNLALLAAGALVVVLLGVRLLQRQDWRFVVYAAVGVAISAFFAMRSGKAEDAFLPGMLQNGGLLLLLLVTNLTRWPLFGFVVGAAEPEAMADDPVWWRRHAGIVAVAARLGWVLIALNTVRLSIMVPLYLAEQVGALGVAKVALGWPAYLVALTAMGTILFRGRTPIDPGLNRSGPAPSN